MQNPPPAIVPAPVKVRELLGEELASLNLRVLSGESHLDNPITHPRVQKPGLAFAGYFAYIKEGRVQIVGESETEYDDARRDRAAAALRRHRQPAGAGVRHHQGAAAAAGVPRELPAVRVAGA